MIKPIFHKRLRKRVLGAALSIIFISLGSSVSANQKWLEFKCSEGRFSVLMPGNPVFTQKKDATPVGDVISNIYVYETPAISLTAEYSDLPGLALMFGSRKKIYAKTQEAFLADVKGEMISMGTVVLDAYRGVEMEYRTDTQKGKARFILIGTRLYVLQAAVNNGTDLSVIDKYFQSFRPIYRDVERSRHARL